MVIPNIYHYYKKMLSKFKEFAVRGNVIDLAVGIVIGAAFGNIVNSLVADIIMPPLGYLIQGVDFTSFKIVLKEAEIDLTGKVVKEGVSINYGKFAQTVLNFVIIAFAIFLLVKGITSLKKKEAPKQQASPIKTDEVILLGEIRDLLKKK